jgi:hypothetical protein
MALDVSVEEHSRSVVVEDVPIPDLRAGEVLAKVTALLGSCPRPGRRVGIHLGNELAKTRFGVLSDIKIEPYAHRSRQCHADWYSLPDDCSNQGVDRVKRLAYADGDVDGVGFDPAQM